MNVNMSSIPMKEDLCAIEYSLLTSKIENSDQNILGKSVGVGDSSKEVLTKRGAIDKQETVVSTSTSVLETPAVPQAQVQPLNVPTSIQSTIPQAETTPVEVNGQIAELDKPMDVTSVPGFVGEALASNGINLQPQQQFPEPEPLNASVELEKDKFSTEMPLINESNNVGATEVTPVQNEIKIDIPQMEPVQAMPPTGIDEGLFVNNTQQEPTAVVEPTPSELPVMPEVPLLQETEPVQAEVQEPSTLEPAPAAEPTPSELPVMPEPAPLQELEPVQATVQEPSTLEPAPTVQEPVVEPIQAEVKENNNIDFNKAISEAKARILSVVEEEFKSLETQFSLSNSSSAEETTAIKDAVKDGMEKIESSVNNNILNFANPIPAVNNAEPQTEVPLAVGL